MKTTILKITLMTLLLSGFNAFAANLDDQSSEGRSAAVDQCTSGACPQKMYARPATQDVNAVNAIIDGIMNEGKPLIDIQNGTAIKDGK